MLQCETIVTRVLRPSCFRFGVWFCLHPKVDGAEKKTKTNGHKWNALDNLKFPGGGRGISGAILREVGVYNDDKGVRQRF